MNQRARQIMESTSVWVSSIFSPMMIPVYSFALLIFSQTDDGLPIKSVRYILAIIFASFLHVIPIVRMKIAGRIKSFDIISREKRIIPLLYSILIYILGYFILHVLASSVMTRALMVCYVVNTIIVFIITNWWKISIHTIGISGPLVVLAYTFGPVVYPFFLLIPLVGVSRIIMKRHTWGQVIAASIIGVVVTVLLVELFYL
ncbi:hypothetical protein JXB12_13470 [candidate division KSB1 bacterium]|nr:hypothetical protein [candidate division KSB1 bacterium]